ncbi:MAG: DUF3426 domain-containing protein [Pseudomonadota bacterium]
MSEDSLEPLITQCPNCTTRFKVTEAQLQVANGQVRCGACLAVFDGTDHLLLDGELLQSAPVEDVDALLDELDHEPADLPPTDIQLGEPQRLSDNISAENLPDDLAALEAEFLAELRVEDAESEAPPLVVASSRDNADPEVDTTADDWIDIAADAAWSDTRDAVNEPAAVPAPVGLTDAAATTAKADADLAGTTPAAALTQDPLDTVDESDAVEPIELTLAPGQAAEPLDDTPAANLASARPRLETPDDDAVEPEAGRPWLTWALIVLAGLGLPAQILWFQYESWVTDLTFRPVYQIMCDVAGCELPPMRDVKLIESRKSVSRTHPQRADARVVDVLIVNNAEFAQPFPEIRVSFSSLAGQLVASRRFRPAEYLRGDMAKVKLMPPRTPVHVSLEMQDPGADAQSFEVEFQ